MKPALTRPALALSLALALAPLAARPAAAGEPAPVELPAEVQAAVDTATAVAGARVVPVDYRPSSVPAGCRITSAALPRPIDGSGRFAVQLSGVGCRAWAWLKVEVWAPVTITTRALRAGEPLDGAVTTTMAPLRSGAAPVVLPPGAVAARALPRGKTLQDSDLRRAGGGAGETVKVLVVSGSLAIETSGKVVPCGRNRTCAVLPAGKHVEGQLVDGRLLVEVP